MLFPTLTIATIFAITITHDEASGAKIESIPLSSEQNIHVSYYNFYLVHLPPEGLGSYVPYKVDTAATINFPDTSGNFATSGKDSYVATLFEGYIYFETGIYELCMTSDDGSKLYLDDTLYINLDGLHDDSMGCRSNTLHGVHKVNIEYFQHTGNSNLMLEWKIPKGTSRSVIPADAWVNGSSVSLSSFCDPGSEYIEGFGCLPFTDRNESPMVYVRNAAAKSWDYHEGIAKSCGGHLASILNANEEAQASKLNENGIASWIGGVQMLQSTSCAKKFSDCWGWSDHSLFVYTNWRDGEPNNYNDKEEDCMVLASSGWNDDECSASWGAIYILPTLFNNDPGCLFGKTSILPSSHPSSITCGLGYYKISYRCMPCAPGTYTDQVGMDYCIPCPSGTSQPFEGRSYCILIRKPTKSAETKKVVYVVVAFSLLALFYFYFAQRRRQGQQDNNISIDSNVGNNVIDEQSSTTERRLRIEQQLIIRRVLVATNHSTRSVGSNLNSSESHSIPNRNTYSGELQKTASSDHLNVVHTSILSQHTRSNGSVQFSERLNEQRDSSPTLQGVNERDNIELEQFRCSAITSKRQSHSKANIFSRFIFQSFHSNEEGRNCCEICLTNYKIGDEVAFSPNEECMHGFHTNCIVDWLLENNSCPICRRDYLGINDVDLEVQSQTSSSRSNISPPHHNLDTDDPSSSHITDFSSLQPTMESQEIVRVTAPHPNTSTASGGDILLDEDET